VKQQDITHRTAALRGKPLQELEAAAHDLVAPWALQWDNQIKGTHLLDETGRSLAVLVPYVRPDGDPAVDLMVSPSVTPQEEARIDALVAEVAPYYLEMFGRRFDGRDLFDSPRVIDA